MLLMREITGGLTVTGAYRIMALLFIAFLGLMIAAVPGSASGETRLTATPTTSPAATPGATPLPAGSSNSDWTPFIQVFDGVEMVLVPAGCFMMGSTDEQIAAAVAQCEMSFKGNEATCPLLFGHESPANTVCLDQPFWIDRYEVSNAQFEAFDGQAGQSSSWPEPDRPRENISWFEAHDFCKSRDARLPTEAEWEYAARGPEGWMYPWGNDFEPDNVVYYPTSDNQTADVGSRPDGASWVGALDMSGNVMEWVNTLDRPYPYSATDGREDETDTIHAREHRGGSWLGFDFMQRATYRWLAAPDSPYGNVGFRCARSE
jgi:formylglycine-generating enzyme required for sulfatase activity